MGEPLSEPWDAVVVGGGLAGIAAALRLAKSGVRVRLCEARRKLGGRAGSFVLPNSGTDEGGTVDYCQHVGMGCCAGLKQLIDWLGQSEDWAEQRELHFFGPSGDYQRLSALPWLPAPLHLSAWLLCWPGLGWRDRFSVALGMLAIRKLRLDEQAERTIALDWLKKIGQTPKAIDHFWSTIIVSALGEELDRVHLAAVGKVLQDGFLNQRDAFHLLVPQRPLGELFGADATERLREMGVEVSLSAVAQRLECRENQLELTINNEHLKPRAVVLALPWHQLPKIEFVGDEASETSLLQAVAERGNRMQGSPITGVHTWWDRAWFDKPHAAIVGRLCQWIFPKPDAFGMRTYDSDPRDQSTELAASYYYQVVISASRQLPRRATSEEIGKLIRDDLIAVFPQASEAKLLRCKVVSDPLAVFSLSPEAERLRPAGNVSHRVQLAGDWTKTGWPATMESGILSGFQAAENVIAGVSNNQ